MRWPPKGCQWGPNDAARAAAYEKADAVGVANSARHIYAFMASWMDEETGVVCASVADLRKKYRCSHANMQKSLKVLREKKLLLAENYVRAYRLPPGVLPKADSEG